MNTNISPLNVSPIKNIKHNLSPFKKFNPRSPKIDDHLEINSPQKYINTQVNPQMLKNLAQSAHHIGYNKNQTYPVLDTNRRQSFLNSIKGRDKINTANQKSNFIKTNFNSFKNDLQGDVVRIRDRKLSHNDLTLSSHTPKPTYRKSQLKPNIQIQQQDEVVHIRDRKLSYQVNSNHFASQIFKKENYHTNTSNAVCMSPDIYRRESDLLPDVNYMKAKALQNAARQKNIPSGFYSPKNIMDHTKKKFPSIKQIKLRKNSQNENNLNSDSKNPVPAFLFKKPKKQSQQNKRMQQTQDFTMQFKQRPVTYNYNSPVKQKKWSIKDFIIVKELGQGKFGKVLLVQQKATKFVCAMKMFKKQQIKNDNFVDQFIRQLKIQLYLNHPNIIKMYGYFDDLSHIYILMQLACQGTLFKFIQELQRQQRLKQSSISTFSSKHEIKQSPSGLSLKQIAVIMYQLCCGIGHLHSNSIIHRDLKPQNIVIHDKTIKLCDFGWSVYKGSQMRTTFCGTPLYLCPQLIVGQQYNQKVDIWAIGIMFYQFLIGPNPFKIQKQQDLANIVFHQIDMNKNEIKMMDPLVIDIINGCLNKNPQQRLEIKQIINHQFFKKYCPDYISGNYINLASTPRNSTTKMSQMMR